MKTNGTHEDTGTGTTPALSPTHPKIDWLSPNLLIIIIVLVSAIVLLIVAVVCYRITNRRRKSHDRHRQLNRSERCDLYENSRTIRDRLVGDSLETIVNRPLPPPPGTKSRSASIPAIPEDDYETPIRLDSFWNKHIEEIRQLPPAPPVFPGQLERLQLDGEGTYIPVIADDEAPLLSPGPMHENTLDQLLCEFSEESGYMVPRSPNQTSLPQNVTETHQSPVPKEIKRKENEYREIARAVVTPHGAEQQCPNTSKRRSLSESAFASNATVNETEKSKDTQGRTYRSTCQLYLAPPTQRRNPPVSTSKPTVVVCIRAEL